MPKIDLENNQFVFYAGQDRTVLLNISDPMANKSRLPMCTLDSELTIPRLIIDLNKMHEAISEETEENGFAAFLQDILLTSYIIRTSAPLKVLEIGAVSGVLSYHLATLLWRMNKESHLCRPAAS